MSLFARENIEKIYIEIQKKLTKNQVAECVKILSKIVENFSNFIVQNVDIHQKIYEDNQTYHKFINNAFSEETYNKLLKLGQSQKRLNKFENARSLGLFSLTKKLFGKGANSIETKFIEYLENIDSVLLAYNVSQETECDFTIYLLTLLTLENIALQAVTDYIKNIKF